jgi:hypothetical protein
MAFMSMDVISAECRVKSVCASRTPVPPWMPISAKEDDDVDDEEEEEEKASLLFVPKARFWLVEMLHMKQQNCCSVAHMSHACACYYHWFATTNTHTLVASRNKTTRAARDKQ